MKYTERGNRDEVFWGHSFDQEFCVNVRVSGILYWPLLYLTHLHVFQDQPAPYNVVFQLIVSTILGILYFM